MSTRPIGAGNFRDIQAEIEALSAQVNRSQKTEEVEKTLETLQQRLDDVLFSTPEIGIGEITQCQLELDRVKNAFQRVLAAPSSATAGGSPSTPKLVASSQPAPTGSEKVFSVSATPPFPSISPLIPTTTTTATTTTATTTIPAHPHHPASDPPSQKVNKSVVREHDQIFALIKQDDPIIYYWVWMQKFSVDDFKQAILMGTKRLTDKDLEKFQTHYHELKAKQNLGEFDVKKAFRPFYDFLLLQFKIRGSLDSFEPFSPACYYLIKNYSLKYYAILKSEQEGIYAKKSITPSSPPQQILEANRAFVSLLWMQHPLCYYWTWFKEGEANGKTFKATVQLGTVLLLEDRKFNFEQAFYNVVKQVRNGKLDWRYEFSWYVQEFEKNPKGPLSDNPVFFKLLKFYDLDHYNRAMESGPPSVDFLPEEAPSQSSSF